MKVKNLIWEGKKGVYGSMGMYGYVKDDKHKIRAFSYCYDSISSDKTLLPYVLNSELPQIRTARFKTPKECEEYAQKVLNSYINIFIED